MSKSLKEIIGKRMPDINLYQVKRAMYIADTYDEMLIIETNDKTTLVFEYEGGYLVSTSTEKGTFEQFFQLMPKFFRAKYEVFYV